MPNAETITKYTGLLDDFLTQELITSSLDSANSTVLGFTEAGNMKVPRIEVGELGAYNRATGFDEEEMVVSYDEIKPEFDRGKGFSVDHVDDEETAFVRSAQGMNVFMKRSVVPQIDATRFMRYANGAGTTATETLTPETIGAAIKEARLVLGEAGALDGARLFMSFGAHGMLEDALKRRYVNESDVKDLIGSINNLTIDDVRSVCFTKNPVIDADGYVPGSNQINFMIINPLAVRQLKKHEKLRVFSPDENQRKDAWLFQYRVFHDAFVLPGLEDGVYAHTKEA